MNNEKDLLILAVDEFFVDKNQNWLQQNKAHILKSRQINSWWAKISFYIEENEIISLSKFLRVLSELNYEKVQTILAPGQFNVLGDTVKIYPILENTVYQISFFWQLHRKNNKTVTIKN